MRDCIRDPLAQRRNQGEHPGLLLGRFLAEHEDKGEDRRALMKAAQGASQSESLRRLYPLAFERWCSGLTKPNASANKMMSAIAKKIRILRRCPRNTHI